MSEQKFQQFVCQICGSKYPPNNETHPEMHGISMAEYKLLYGEDNDSYIQCEYVNEDTQHQCDLNKYSDSNEGFCILHHPSKEKNHSMFNQVLEILIKMWMHDKKEFHLEGSYFPIRFMLSNITIENKVYFTGCHFFDEVNIKAIFMNIVYLRKCIFEEKSSFKNSEFRSMVRFSSSVFMKEAELDAHYYENAAFYDVEFHGNTNFRATAFEDRASFIRTIFPQHPYYVNFMGTRFNKPHSIKFSEVDFSRALFLWTDLSKIIFQNVRWPVTSKIKGARHYLTDEFSGEHYLKEDMRGGQKYISAKHYDHVQDLYQQLKRNFENQGSYAEAGDFYYGEMECYRKSSWARRFLPSLVNLYRISSGYGQRYIRAGIVLILMLLFFAGAHTFLGLEPTPHNYDYSKIQYSFNLNFRKANSFVSDLFISTVYCVEVLIREEEPDRLFRPMSTKGDILNSTYSILVYLQLLFFILAVRRHFKR
ncbi:MAG: pentapeptide repeat-containing protein [Candidatus Hodarchaeota archaeon]